MKVHLLCGPPPPELARALTEFEEPFTYPLGSDRSFRITHGDDYTLFFRTQGLGACFVAEHQGRVSGVMGTALRRIWMPDGRERVVAYLGDLKIAASARGGLVLARLAKAAEGWLRPKVDAAFGVVMGGTALTPRAYTNRAGIPGFDEVGRLTLLRLSTKHLLTDHQQRSAQPPPGANPRFETLPGRRPALQSMEGSGQIKAEGFVTTAKAGLACYQRLSRGRYACPAGDARARSQMAPVWLMHPDGTACGLLEDTRKAKRLVMGDGSELLSAHLSCFAYSSIVDAAELLEHALSFAVTMTLPGLFVAVIEQDAGELAASLPNIETHPAPAAVYATGLDAGAWNINTSEI